jgi:photosystem II stability/assembly factor-like uncharacterized protein
MFGNWTSLNPGILGGVYNGVCFLPGNTQVGYACGAGLDTISHMPKALIIKTTDGGSTWEQQNPNTASFMLLAIYFSDANNGYACGLAGAVVRTTNGGTDWTAQTYGTGQLNYVRFPSNGQTGYIGYNSGDSAARVYKSTDGGGSWVATAVGQVLDHSISCGMATDNIGVCTGPSGFAYTTTDGFGTGKYTDPWAQGCLLTAAAYSPNDNNKAYLVGNDTVLGLGIIRYTAIGGSPHWDSVRCPVVASFNCVDYASPETAYVGGADGFIGGSFNAHDFWKTNTGVTNAIKSINFPRGPDTGYAAAGPVILKTTDGGQPWVPAVAEGKTPATLLTGIKVVTNPGRLGIALRSDANVTVTVYDAAGRAVLTQTAVKGTNFLPLKAGAYFVRSGANTVRAVVAD